MSDYTKKGLFYLMIYQIISIVALFVVYSFFLSLNQNMFDFENFSAENFSSFLIILIPTAIIAVIGGLLGFIGIIFILVGRKEFGEKHQKFIFYAIIVFCLSLVVSFVLGLLITFSSISSSIGGSMFSSIDPTELIESYRTMISISVITTPITAALGGLIWIFGLYQLENEMGRKVLYSAYIVMIITAIAASISSILVFEELLSSGALEELFNSGSFGYSSYSNFSSLFSQFGFIGLIQLTGQTIYGILLFYAMYIPYKRITSGELISKVETPYTYSQDRVCPNCQNPIPFDANNCPYCGKQFENYL